MGLVGIMGYEQQMTGLSALNFYPIHPQALWLKTRDILDAWWVFRLLSFKRMNPASSPSLVRAEKKMWPQDACSQFSVYLI